MNIPNDTGHPYRLNKFIEYQHKVPPIGPATYIAWAKRLNMSPSACVMLAWFNSMSYCEITAIYLFYMLPYQDVRKQYVQEFWNDNKEYLIFASARKYVKNMDWFIPLMFQFMRAIKRQPFRWLTEISGKGNAEQKYDNVYKFLMKWQYMGRFSVELFTDAIVQMSREGLLGDLQFKAHEFDWRHGSNITSGMLNMFYKDQEAEDFDKSGKLPLELQQYLEHKIVEVQKAVKKAYPEQDTSISVITPKMCSYRNLFKGSRYGGYHHDRQLEQLLHYQRVYGDSPLWSTLFKLREEIFVPELLGEIGGWTGVRKERKKLWLNEGRTGVETIS